MSTFAGKFKCFMRLLVCLIIAFTSLAGNGAELDSKMEAYGLVDLKGVVPEAVVDLMYARSDNFTGVVLYTDLTKAYLRPKAAKALRKAQDELTRRSPGYRLKVCDASRPMSVQKKMYRVVRGTSKARYVSNPANGGGLHNYGMAVDITIVDGQGRELPMGTKVDHLGREANIDREESLVKQGVITRAEQRNRQLLRDVMKAGGWRPLKSEWWHFNLCTRAYARANLRLLDF